MLGGSKDPMKTWRMTSNKRFHWLYEEENLWKILGQQY